MASKQSKTNLVTVNDLTTFFKENISQNEEKLDSLDYLKEIETLMAADSNAETNAKKVQKYLKEKNTNNIK